jgi:hypothetical protein
MKRYKNLEEIIQDQKDKLNDPLNRIDKDLLRSNIKILEEYKKKTKEEKKASSSLVNALKWIRGDK